MKITDITVVLTGEDDHPKLKAYVNITIDDCFMVRGLKIIDGRNGIFVAMPNKKTKHGLFRDVAHPLNPETRKMINDQVLAKYQEVIANIV